ncbi:MAG: hypothetical protein LBE85_05020 [Candidatus Accumulibacter sp.]|jgi:hypothetical protein|nr:hypothetical protein [Accumulibacter sp.]
MSDTQSPDGKKRSLPRGWSDNPFEAPTAHVEDARRPIDDALADEPNQLAAGRGLAWWSEGWHLFREATGLWIGIGFVMLLISVVVGLIPIIGNLGSLLFPVFGAGLMLGCHSLDSGGELHFGHLFAGFQSHCGRLLAVGLLYLLGVIAMVVIVFALGLGGGFAASAVGGGEDAAVLSGLLGGLVGLLLIIPLAMSVWFAPALVALHDLTALEAMKQSFRGCLRNVLPFLIYSLVFLGLAVLATLPVALGWLLLTPVTVCSVYASYRDILTNRS